MTKEFQNPTEEKVEEETVSNPSEQEQVDQVANKAAEKPQKAAHEFEKTEKEFSI
ncbi:MAG: hypothetical protein ACRD3N_02905 [Terracidiphilus sp.]